MLNNKILVTTLCILAGSLDSVTPNQAQTTPYPAARHGGNYMYNYYLPPAPSTSPWAPAWSPDGKWIAVASGARRKRKTMSFPSSKKRASFTNVFQQKREENEP